jgi:glycosyltransferase involved in cell wall biosynthesis
VSKKPRVAIVIPAFNESAVIQTVIHEVDSLFGKSPYDYRIVVVDDGSTDDTAKKAQAGGATVIRHIINAGCGGATATGLSYAEQQDFDIAVTMDGDGQHHAEDALKGVALLGTKKADLLIGSRLLNSEGMSRVKFIGNKGLSVITFMLFGINVTDSQSGLRIFSKRALIELKWRTNGYEFCSEMLWRAKQQGLKIKEYPVRAIYTDYSKAKGQNNWNALNIVKSLVKRRMVELFGE